MFNLQEQPVGFAILCDVAGTIRRIIRDELNLFCEVNPGRSFTSILDAGSVDKGRRFLAETQTQGAVFGWELNVLLNGQVTSLHFAGSTVTNGLLIIGAKTRNGVAQLYEELIRINNEQMNALRTAAKEQTIQSRMQVERDNGFYNELSRLNNELANVQRKLAKQNAELERLNQEKNQFLGMAAHDMRTPLGIILSYSEFLMEEISPILDVEHLEFLEVIQESSEFMLRLIDDLLDISKIEAGKLVLELYPTNLVTLVERNVMLNRFLAEKKNMTIVARYDENLPEINVDGPKIQQVLNNLISNAVKFSTPNTTVSVSVTQNEHDITFSVQDQGPGIPAGEIDKLFKPFARTNVNSAAGEKSTGLGLTIVRRIVEGHRGKIWVDSKEGHGSTFYVSLPVDLEIE